MGRNISVVNRCSSLLFLTPHLTKQVLQTLVLSHLDYCSVIWSPSLSGTTKINLVKLQQVQNGAAKLALKCTQRANINNMHDQLSWLKVDVRLKASLLSFIKNNTLNNPDCLGRPHLALMCTHTSLSLPVTVSLSYHQSLLQSLSPSDSLSILPPVSSPVSLSQ